MNNTNLSFSIKNEIPLNNLALPDHEIQVLIVDDDDDIRTLLSDILQKNGLHVFQAADGNAMWDMLKSRQIDLIVLDLNLPEVDGLTLCRQLRVESSIPVIMLTAKTNSLDRVIGLETGADDYLTKPFSIREFIARVKAIIRRTEIGINNKNISEEIISCNQLSIDPQKRKVTLNEIKIELTPKEFDLLYLFMSNPGKSYSRENLLNLVWGYEFSGYEHTVNSHINRLRTKIETDLSTPKYILTTWGVGYRFADEIK